MQNILGHEPFKSRVFCLRGENWEVCKYFEGKQLATGLIYYSCLLNLSRILKWILFFLIILFIYFWLSWVFVAAWAFLG